MHTAAQAPHITLTTSDIMGIIPHRPPFLLVDRAVIVEPEKKIVGYKGVTMNEPFFLGHFPGRPIMPGVLIIEAMAQTACVLMLRRPDLKGKLAFFMGIEEAKFRKPVVPGDLLELRIEVLRAGGRVGKVRGEAFVGGEMATEANFTFIMTERQD
jgi:beta-hydroxyacyl-ACP dehydratase FabZ